MLRRIRRPNTMEREVLDLTTVLRCPGSPGEVPKSQSCSQTWGSLIKVEASRQPVEADHESDRSQVHLEQLSNLKTPSLSIKHPISTIQETKPKQEEPPQLGLGTITNLIMILQLLKTSNPN